VNPWLASTAETVRQAGARISIQLSVGRAASAGSLWMPGLGDIQEMPGMAPSAVTFPGGMKPREMTIEEISQTIELFGKAAARVKKVGFVFQDIDHRGLRLNALRPSLHKEVLSE